MDCFSGFCIHGTDSEYTSNGKQRCRSMEYPVLYGKETVGKVTVCKEGLYYHFLCRCQTVGNTFLRLYAAAGNQNTCLGVMVPEKNCLCLETRLPTKRIGTGELSFFLAAKHDAQKDGTFIPVYPEEPFQYIARLKDAFLEIREGRAGVCIRQN